MGTETTLNILIAAYRSEQISKAELEQLDQLLLGGLVYYQQKKAWKILFAENGIVEPDKNAVVKGLTVWEQLRGIRATILSLAAAVLLLVSATWLLWQYNTPSNSPMDLIEKNVQDMAVTMPQTRMGTNTAKIDENWEGARNALIDKNYTTAIQLLENIKPRTVEQIFFLGTSYMQRAKTGDFEQAATHFQTVLTLKTGNFEKEARWYLALSELKAGHKDAARSILETIKNANGWKADDATALLKTMFGVSSNTKNIE